MSVELQLVEKQEEMENLIKSNKFVIADFSALWCGPCQYIDPIFEELSTNYKEVKFIKIDIDKSEELSKKYIIECYPTFIIFKEGEIETTIRGANKKQIVDNLDKLVQKKTPAKEGEVIDYEEFQKVLKENQLVIVDFFAEWCGPCRFISPSFEDLKIKNQNIKFIKCNVDIAKEISSKCGINCMPTFVSFRNGKEENRFSGANKKKLIEITDDLLSTNLPINVNFHEHSLFERNREEFVCDSCYNRSESKKKMKCFVCKDCGFIICEKCFDSKKNNLLIIINKDAIITKLHEKHPLLRIKRPCVCDICRKRLDESLCCEKCDFDLCDECYKKDGQ